MSDNITTQKKCLACGNNQTNHIMSWFNQSTAIIFMTSNRSSLLLKIFPYLSKGIEFLFYNWMKIMRRIGIVVTNTDHTKAATFRGRVLWEEAIARGIPMYNYITCGIPTDIYHFTLKGRSIFFTGLPRPAATKSGSEWWLDDKWILKKKLIAHTIPVARGGSFSRFAPLLAMYRTLEKPVIIKPRLGSRGRHTTTYITTEAQLKEAFDTAKQLCYWVVMEEHLVGSVYRATMVDNQLAGVLSGDPPRITGDGIHTIAELIEIKNTTRHPEVKDVVPTNAHHTFLARLNLTLQSILPAEKTIDLIEKIGISYGGNSAEVTHLTHPETKRILEEAAKIIDDPIIGFDFIIEHIDQSPHGQKWGIIECNGVPFINLHHDPIEGPSNNVAAKVWDYVETHIDEL
jgi:cyanophycin synthetase